MKIWRDVWSVLTTEIEFQAVMEGSVDAFTQVLALAGTLTEQKDATAIAPLVGQLGSLLDVLNSPLMQVAGAAVPFVPVATGLLKFILETTKEEPTLEQQIALVGQAAYLQTVVAFLEEHADLKAQLTEPASEATQRNIKRLGENLELKDARAVLLCFHRSELAGQFNPILQARFEESGLESERAALVVERIARSVHRSLKEAVAEVQDEAKDLAAIYGQGWQRDLEAYRSIDDYLKTYIQSLPQETVFDEAFTFQDIYVPSDVQPVKDCEVQKREPRQNIEAWAKDRLLDEQKAGQVLFVQGGPGRGKSVFCRMFADWVRRELHPIFTPIVIRLRDGIDLKRNFDEALASAVGWDFVKSDNGWLTDANTRYLFLLDGFDELFLEQGSKGSVQELLDQVSRFQEQAARNPERGHRLLITGRPLALYGIERQMPTNLDWVSIALMEDSAQEQWFRQWSQVTDQPTAAAFQTFLQDSGCPEQVQVLAQEPLLLYLLGKMHRDGALDVAMFSAGDVNVAKVEVYTAAVDWVLTRQRPERVTTKLADLGREALRAVLAEAGLCVVQSGNERALISMIEKRLVDREDTEAAALIEAAQSNNDKNPLKNALAAFYLKSGETENSVEFFHKSFGEFLCAERLADSFMEWTERRRAGYAIKPSEFKERVYDLLGYGHLSGEILEYFMVLLQRKLENDQWVILFERLNEFYLQWSDGRFIEAIDEKRFFPLEKAQQMQAYDIDLGQRQVDIYTGLNLLKILLAIHRHGQANDDLNATINFHPCGDPEQADNETAFKKTRLLQVIHYSDSIQAFTFSTQLHRHLRNADLRNANLSNTDLSNANLSNTDLRNANLSNANLSNANLSNADLSSPRQIFVSALGDVREAYWNTNLSYADLRNADLRNADLSNANLSEVKWNSSTQWANVVGLETAQNIPGDLRQHLQGR
ncbi:pentapeptide repeat-containing protein [Spirulina major CS-329]|uniref:NACHT domain-containing protein n=1 Tax=Spirulina major TaxID=270636 RepID=UPI00232D4C01|nr:pentapeptide repeat-containing protein [Spirulina major]MDB9504973.1 pentapeptide repeat-containing protein [Spirulina major CS-329]